MIHKFMGNKLLRIFLFSVAICIVQPHSSAALDGDGPLKWQWPDLFEVSSFKEVICPDGKTGILMTLKVKSTLLPQRYHTARWCPMCETDAETCSRWMFTSYHKTGHKVDEGEYLDGEMHGKWISWHPNGVKEAESHYANGKQVGSFTGWHDNGAIAVTGSYLDGKPHDVWVYRATDGRVVKKIHWQAGEFISIEKFD